jgi:GNAT superfamily N-acetyltransferase
MLVRPRQESDADGLIAIAKLVHEQDGYPPYLPGGDFEALLFERETLDAWVVDIDDHVVGQVALHPRTGRRAMELAEEALGVPAERLGVVARLFVTPPCRGMGVGRALLETAAGEATARGLHPILDVATHLQDAVRLYERCGWVRAGEVTLQFPDGTTLNEFVYLASPLFHPR